MKFSALLKSAYMVSGITVILCIFLIRPTVAQEKSKNDSKSTIKLKILNEKDGKATVFDTIFTTDKVVGQEEIDLIMKDMKMNMEMEMDELSKDMNELRFNIEVEIQDSLLSDSLRGSIDRVIALSPGMKIYRGKGDRDFRFDFPSPHDIPTCPEESGIFEWGEWCPVSGNYIRRYSERRETLSDMLGDIPLDNIKSYSIKDRKGGKRIIIDVEDYPVVRGQERIIYRDRPMSRSKYHRQ